ncbi:MAG: 5'/3'-nucleotidase SurE [Phycisphaerales bacterium]|jgi:5'-nucleotidase
MRILHTNDDGISAIGIASLHEATASLGERLVVAPASGQSAESHGITFHRPVMVHQARLDFGGEGVAVEGTPADCVKLALRALWPERHGAGTRPDLVISGMNHGANVGINVIYSGTVAAAVEAAFLGVPAIAVSLMLCDKRRADYRRAAWIARQAIDRVLAAKLLDAHRVININVPCTERPDAPMPEICVVPMNTAAGIDGYERRTAPDGRTYYWPAGNGMEFVHTAEGSDVERLYGGAVTITPLFYDLSDRGLLERMRRALA